MNTTSSGNWGGCTYPKKAQGIHLCSPATNTTGTTASFKAAASSFGNLRKIELWVDGKKRSGEPSRLGTLRVVQLHGHVRGRFPPCHALRSRRRQSSAGAQLHVHGGIVGVQRTIVIWRACLLAREWVHSFDPGRGTGIREGRRSAARMEIWVDGVKKFTENTSTSFTTRVSLGPGRTASLSTR